MTNEEKILDLLEKQGRELERHGRELEKQSRVLEQQGRTLEQQGLELERQGREIAKINIRLENVIEPRIEALAEGQKTILETLASKSRVEALEDEVSFLKQMIKNLATEISDLKKAQ